MHRNKSRGHGRYPCEKFESRDKRNRQDVALLPHLTLVQESCCRTERPGNQIALWIKSTTKGLESSETSCQSGVACHKSSSSARYLCHSPGMLVSRSVGGGLESGSQDGGRVGVWIKNKPAPIKELFLDGPMIVYWLSFHHLAAFFMINIPIIFWPGPWISTRMSPGGHQSIVANDMAMARKVTKS